MSRLSPLQYDILTTLLVRRPLSTTRLVALFPACTQALEALVLEDLVRERGEGVWAISALGTLTLLLAIREGAAPAPLWPESLGWIAALLDGKATPPAKLPHALFEMLDESDALSLLEGASPAWQQLMIDYWSAQALLEARPIELDARRLGKGAQSRLSLWLEEESWWLADGQHLPHWPDLAQGWQQELDQGAWVQLGAQRPREPLFSALVWLGVLQQHDPALAASERKSVLRQCGHQAALQDALRQWDGERHSVGLFEMLQLPPDEVFWGHLWIDLCAMSRHGESGSALQALRKWSLDELLAASPRHRLMGLCQDLLRLLTGRPVVAGPLVGIDTWQEEAEPLKPAGWLNWLQGLGRSAGASKVKERLVWNLLLEGPTLECRVQKLGVKGEWTAGRRVELALVSSQYPALLGEEDWALLRQYGKEERHWSHDFWTLLAAHPHLYNAQGQRLQLALTQPLIYLTATGQARLFPEVGSGASIVPLAGDLWQVVRQPESLRELLPAERRWPVEQLPRVAEALGQLEGLHWCCEDAALGGNARLIPWPGEAGVQLDWRKGVLHLAFVTQGEQTPALPLAHGDAVVRSDVRGNDYWQRDLVAEREAWRELCQRLALDMPRLNWQLEEEAAIEFLAALPEWVAGGVRIFWHEESQRLRSLDETTLSLRIEQRQEWFALEGSLALDEHQVLDLRLLLRQFRPGQKSIMLDEQTSVIISDKLSERLTLLGAMLDDEQRVSRRLAYPLMRLLSAVSTQGDEAWNQLQDEWAQPAECPDELLTPLRDYQREGVQWMASLASHGFGACLADDMGLGKTLQALTVLRLRASAGPALVVVPKSVLTNWQEEAARFAPELEIVTLDQSWGGAHLVQGAHAGQVVLINYGLLPSLGDALERVSWASLVIDEAQQIKNAGTQRAKILTRLEGAFRLALSGTPVENHLGELWSLFAFINPGLLGSQRDFKRRFGRASRDPQHMALLRSVIHPFVLRRLKQEVLAELPEKTEIVHHITLSQAERELYEATRREVVQQIQSSDGRTLMHVLSGLTRLRRLCCSPSLLLPEWQEANSKLDEAMALLEEAIDGGHRVLVFSQFVDLLTLLRRRLEARGWEYCYLDGACSMKERQHAIERFRSESVPLFLISLKAGGTGLNLTQADTVLHLDPWWNPAVEDQASDRAHRMGQTQPVTVYRLVCEQTVEEKIVALHSEKRALADSLLSGQSQAGPLDLESLRNLLLG